MDTYSITLAIPNDIEEFFPQFEKSLTTQFSEYSTNVVSYYLEREYPKDVLKGEIKNQRIYLLLAKKDNQIVGFLIGQKIYGGIGFCEWIAVDDAHQRQGIGSALLGKWEETVIKHGGHKIHLWTAEHNIDYYKKIGYVLVGKIPDNYFGSDDFFMYKTLRQSDEKEYLK